MTDARHRTHAPARNADSRSGTEHVMPEWTISVKQLRALYALDERGEKGMPTAGATTNTKITYATAEALEARGLARITVEAGDYRVFATDKGHHYRVFVTDKGHEYAAAMRKQGRR